MIGKMIAQYRIVEALGKGGMGTVYKAQDTQLNRTVVLKLLSQNLLGNDKARSRFLREARLASALDHPNICTIYEIQETGGYYYIAMQYIEGQTLKQAINRRPLSNSTFLSIALQVADALASAHDRGVIHRDIKPQNIMITPRGQAKVLDFGLAKNINESNGPASGAMVSGDLTDQGKTLGTPSYMSPEQARCERLDRRSDIFSFGAVLYEMITGQKAFAGSNTVDIMYGVCNQDPKPISDLNSKAAPGFQELLARAMAKDPNRRYQSMQALITDLKHITATTGGRAGIPDGLHQPFAPVERAGGWMDRLIPPAIRRVFFKSSASGSAELPPQRDSSQQVLPSNESRSVQGADFSIHDDFPLIPGQHKTLAVLPFRNLGGSIDESARVSLLEALIIELTKFKSLTIRPTSMVLQYLEEETNPTEVGRDLGVDAVLLGSCLGSANRMRVTTQLIDIITGNILWAGKIDVTNNDPIRLLDQMCQRIVGELSKKAAGSAFDLLVDEDQDVRMDAISALKFSNDPKAIEALAEALKDRSQLVKAAAADALACFGRRATPILSLEIEDALARQDMGTARYGVQAAGRIQSSELVPILLEALVSDDSFVASEAALALGNIRDQRACSDLVEALSRADANIRFAAVQALGLIADPQSLAPLENRLRQDEDEGVQAKALWAINRIRRKPFGTQTFTIVHTPLLQRH